MKSTGDFYISSFRIKFKKENEPIFIVPFGDIHRSSPACSVERWHEFLDWARSQKNVYFLGMGDYDDVLSASEREGLLDARIHDSTRRSLNDWYIHFSDRLLDEIWFMKNKIIGLLEGNHYAMLDSGITTTQYLCQRLDCQYLGSASFLRVFFDQCFGKSVNTRNLDFFAAHGKCAARTLGASINQVDNMGDIAEADIYFLAHDHKKSVAMRSRLRLSHSNKSIELEHRKIVLCRTGSFLKAYEPGQKSYVVDSLMTPSDLGIVKVDIIPKRTHKKRFLEVHASI